MTDAVRLYVKGITLLRRFNRVGLVVLTNQQEDRQICVPCTSDELRRVERLIGAGDKHSDTLAHVLWAVVSENSHSAFEIHITGVSRGSYTFVLLDVDKSKKYALAAPDALELVLTAGLPVYIGSRLFGMQGVEFHPGREQMTIPVNILTDELLKMAFDSAIEKEDYELASVIKEEMDNRKRENE